MAATNAPAQLAIEGDLATITLSRPTAFNAIDLHMARTLEELAQTVEASSGVKVLVIRGDGPAFCGGGDIRHFVDHLDDIGGCIRALLTPYHRFLETLRRMPKVVLASVHGSVAGAGLSLAAMCDLCIAADDTIFTPAYAKIGVSPDGGGTYGLARAVGPRRALQIFLAEERFGATEAADWGLVTKLVPADALADETAKLALRIARTSGDAIAGTKRLVGASLSSELAVQLEDEMETLIGCMAGDLFTSSVKQFVARS
jgi:enoyl-CoA hydratase/carnithine racemase